FKFLKTTKLNKEYFNSELVGLYTTSLNNFAAWLTNNGYIEEGIKYFEKSLEIRENKNALYNLWGINNALGKIDEAKEYKRRFDELE
ncbi:tetratricopeptide repeat protein, partial [Patescibacteria group bacterium]